MKHRARSRPSWIGITALLVVAFGGCSEDKPTAPPRQPPPPGDKAVADFSLQDVNPNSATHDQRVSPRQHLGRVSTWYFGHSN